MEADSTRDVCKRLNSEAEDALTLLEMSGLRVRSDDGARAVISRQAVRIRVRSKHHQHIAEVEADRVDLHCDLTPAQSQIVECHRLEIDVANRPEAVQLHAERSIIERRRLDQLRQAPLGRCSADELRLVGDIRIGAKRCEGGALEQVRV